MVCILSLETSTRVCSVALHADGTLISSSEIHVEQIHGAKLAVLIDQLFHAAGVSPQQLSAIAISSGPGSYTGLRIGTSTAKGLCYALKIPLIEVGTLELLASQVKGINISMALLCPMIDARRQEVYCALMDANMQPLMEVHAKVIDRLSFLETLSTNRIIFFGNGSSKCRNLIEHQNAIFIDDIYPKASAMGTMAFERLERGLVADLSTFEPFYLKDFAAKKSKRLI
jgi:tRNA threonylcarbamoyladenosine biosynthesis protein TsaB